MANKAKSRFILFLALLALTLGIFVISQPAQAEPAAPAQPEAYPKTLVFNGTPWYTTQLLTATCTQYAPIPQDVEVGTSYTLDSGLSQTQALVAWSGDVKVAECVTGDELDDYYPNLRGTSSNSIKVAERSVVTYADHVIMRWTFPIGGDLEMNWMVPALFENKKLVNGYYTTLLQMDSDGTTLLASNAVGDSLYWDLATGAWQANLYSQGTQDVALLNGVKYGLIGTWPTASSWEDNRLVRVDSAFSVPLSFASVGIELEPNDMAIVDEDIVYVAFNNAGTGDIRKCSVLNQECTPFGGFWDVEVYNDLEIVAAPSGVFGQTTYTVVSLSGSYWEAKREGAGNTTAGVLNQDINNGSYNLTPLNETYQFVVAGAFSGCHYFQNTLLGTEFTFKTAPDQQNRSMTSCQVIGNPPSAGSTPPPAYKVYLPSVIKP